MGILLYKWITSRTNIYRTGCFIKEGSPVIYTFNNGLGVVSYTINPLTDIYDAPSSPNITLFEILDPKNWAITNAQQASLITMPGDVVTISDMANRTKSNIYFGKVYCHELDWDDGNEIADNYTSIEIIGNDNLRTINLRLGGRTYSIIEYDNTFRSHFAGDILKIMPHAWSISLLYLPLVFNIRLTITFEDDYNRSVSGKTDTFFKFYINNDYINVRTLCSDAVPRVNGGTQVYSKNNGDILTFDVVRLSGSNITNITEL
jgi:hypothetical protein